MLRTDTHTALRLRYGAANIAALALGLLKSRLLAGSFGVSGIGIFSQLTSILQTTSALVLLGTSAGSMREIASANGNDDGKEYGTTVRAAWFIAVVLGLIGTATMIIGSPWIAEASLADMSQWLLVAAIAPCVLFTALGGYFTATMEGNRQFRRLGNSKVLLAAITVALAVPATMLQPRLGIPTVIVLTSLGGLVVTAWTSGHKPERNPLSKFPGRGSAVLRIVKTGLATMAAAAVIPLGELVCRSTYIEYRGLESMGLAAAALALFGLTYSVTWLSSSPTLVPDIARYSHDPAKVALCLGDSLRIAVPTAIASAALLCTLSGVAIHLAYGLEFAQGASTLAALAAISPMRICFDCLRYTHLALGARRIYSGSCIAMSIVQTSTFYLSIDTFGSLAFPFSMAAAYTCGLVACLHHLKPRVALQSIATPLVYATLGTTLLSVLVRLGHFDSAISSLTVCVPAAVWAVKAQLNTSRKLH